MLILLSSSLHSRGPHDDCKPTGATSALHSTCPDPTWFWQDFGWRLHDRCKSQRASEENIYIFCIKSQSCTHVSPGGQESAKRENGGTRVCQKVCITSVNTLPCRIKTTSVAEGKKETMVSRITHTLKKKPDGGFTTDYFVETKYSHARNQWIIFVLTSCFADKGNNPSCCHLRFAPLFSSMYIVSHLIDWGILFYMEYNFL